MMSCIHYIIISGGEDPEKPYIRISHPFYSSYSSHLFAPGSLNLAYTVLFTIFTLECFCLACFYFQPRTTSKISVVNHWMLRRGLMVSKLVSQDHITTEQWVRISIGVPIMIETCATSKLRLENLINLECSKRVLDIVIRSICPRQFIFNR